MTRTPTLATVVGAAALLLAACGSYAIPRTYVLGGPPTAVTWGVDGHPVIDLKTVSTPDYLDSTDILRRVGPNEIRASETGVWGERVSTGVTRALANALAARLPGVVLETTGPRPPDRTVRVELQRFEIDGDGRCTLAARWEITGGRRASVVRGGGAFVRSAGAPGDSAAASAMSAAIDDLADQMAQSIQTDLAAS